MLKMAKCTCCERNYPTNEMVSTPMANRGGRNAYMCTYCATHNNSYHTSNNVKQGKTKANCVGVGIELETSFTTQYARNTLFEYGFIPTYDCSLHGERTCEYVSGIMQGLNIASKLCVTLDTLIQNSELEINSSCGTHFHVSINAMKDANGEQVYMQYIKRFYHSLFIPLYETMKNHPTPTAEFFGRDFTNYAREINQYTDADNRYNFINVTNNSNIEFRLNKYVNAKQFQALMKFEVEAVKCIVTNFCEHFNDENIDTTRYANMTEYRTHKAKVTAKKLVKLFTDYAAPQGKKYWNR